MARPQTVLTVVAARRLTPHLVRLTLGGEQFDAVHARWAEKGATDQYVKLLFADPALGLEPPYDLDALRERLAPEQLPVRRTYTVRRMDAAARTMDVDFVVHGASDDGAAPGHDGGLAGAWAASEPVGQQVAFLGPGGAYRPDPTADWHLLAGDESALPAIAAALEDHGYAPSVHRTDSGIQICQHHCPVSAVAAAYPEFCEAEREAVARIVDTHAQPLALIADGHGICTTNIPLAGQPVSASADTAAGTAMKGAADND